MLALNILAHDFSTHLSTKGALLSPSEKTAQIDNFRSGIKVAQSFHVCHESIAACTPSLLVDFLKTIHTQTAEALYRDKPDEKAGYFRRDASFILRHPRADAGYDGPTQFGRIVKFLNTYAGPALALDYLIGYYKFFIRDNRKVPSSEVEKFQKGIAIVASNGGVPFDAKNLSSPYNENELKALDKVYRIFVPSAEVPAKILEWATQLLKDLEAKRDPREIFAVYYLAFIEIHPFIDGNFRTIMLFLNTLLLLEQNYIAFFLHGEAAHRFADYYFDKGQPDQTQFIRYVKEQIPLPAIYQAIGHITQATLFLQHLAHASFASFRKISEDDRISVAAIFKADSGEAKSAVTSALDTAGIPYATKDQSIIVDDVNSPEVGLTIQNAFYKWRDSQKKLASPAAAP